VSLLLAEFCRGLASGLFLKVENTLQVLTELALNVPDYDCAFRG
jgi:hypothetical protein